MRNFASISITTAIYLADSSSSFGINHVIDSRPSTKLYLEDHIAKMIDMELHRLSHKDEFEQKWQENNKKVVEVVPPHKYEFSEDELSNNMVEMRRDRIIADKNPQKYCAERCVSTGHCDVFEDLFDFNAEEVMEFCTNCVLSEEEEACDVPDKFLEDNVQTLMP